MHYLKKKQLVNTLAVWIGSFLTIILFFGKFEQVTLFIAFLGASLFAFIRYMFDPSFEK
jgi:hypothetical protein